MLLPHSFAILVLISATTAEDSSTAASDSLSSPLFQSPFSGFFDKFKQQNELFPSLTDLTPEVVINDEKFEVKIKVQGYQGDDLKVKVEGGYIYVQGLHKNNQGNSSYMRHIFHSYSLPANASVSDVTATITTDGNLIVTAPIRGPVDSTAKTDREVHIVDARITTTTSLPDIPRLSTNYPTRSTSELTTPASITPTSTSAASTSTESA